MRLARFPGLHSRHGLPALLLILLALAQTACQPAPPNCARFPGTGTYCLQTETGPAFSTLQHSVLTVGEQRFTLLTRIENDDSGLRFAGMTPLGQTLLNVSWENGVLRADLPPKFAARLDPAWLPALLQIALWPVESVRAGLSPELDLVEENAGRRLRQTGAGEARDLLKISWEGDLPYHRLRIEFTESPARFRLDARAIVDEAQEALKAQGAPALPRTPRSPLPPPASGPTP